MPRVTKIQIRRGNGIPDPADFVEGEPGWDSTNGKLYVKDAGGAMVEISRKITTSTSDPTGGNDGDIWIKYTA